MLLYKDLNNTYGSFAESVLKVLRKKIYSIVARFVFWCSKLFHPNLLGIFKKAFY
jgi:hypothetical protein